MKNLIKNNNFLFLIIGTLLFVVVVSSLTYAYFAGIIENQESQSTIVGTAGTITINFDRGGESGIITASNAVPGWVETRSFTVSNISTLEGRYQIILTNIYNNLISGGLTYELTGYGIGTPNRIPIVNGNDSNQNITSQIEINPNESHSYAITIFYENLEANQGTDMGKSFSMRVGIV